VGTAARPFHLPWTDRINRTERTTAVSLESTECFSAEDVMIALRAMTAENANRDRACAIGVIAFTCAVSSTPLGKSDVLGGAEVGQPGTRRDSWEILP